MKSFLLGMFGACLIGLTVVSAFVAGYLFGSGPSRMQTHEGAARFSLHEFKERDLSGGMMGETQHQLIKIDHLTGQVWRLTSARLPGEPGWTAEGWEPVADSFGAQVQSLMALSSPPPYTQASKQAGGRPAQPQSRSESSPGEPVATLPPPGRP